MDREKQLAKNTTIVAISKICTQFMSFFLLPLYTALLSVEEYGTIDLLNTYISLLIPIFFFQMDQAIFRFLIDVRNLNTKKKILISSAVISTIFQVIVFLLVYLIAANYINNEYKYFLATNVVASMFANLFLQICRGLGDNSTYSIGSLISGASTILLNVLFLVVFKLGATGMLCATFIANILCVIFVFFKKKIYSYISMYYFSIKNLKKLWKYSIPLIPNQLSWWVVNTSDRTLIGYFLGMGFNGIYSAANKFSSICITALNIFNLTWSESASMYINDEDSSDYFSNIVNTTLKLFSSLCLGIIAIMPFLFKYLITGVDYADAYFQIPILMLSTIFNIVVSLLGGIYVALKKSKEIAKTSIYAAIINIFINILLIKKIGLYAASISTLVAYVAMAIYRLIDVQKYIKIKLEKKYVAIFFLLSILIIFTYYYKNLLLCIISLLITTVLAIIINKNILLTIVGMIKKKIKRG